jgi:hypothetical protein
MKKKLFFVLFLWSFALCLRPSIVPGSFKANDTRLQVHCVPHTHDDVGWLKTVDQYYTGLKQVNINILQCKYHYYNY